MFAKKGYSSVGMRELAAALGIGCGSIYNHIESKEALLYEFFEELYELLYVKAMKLQKRNAGPALLHAIVAMHMQLHESMPWHFQVVESEWRHLSEPLQQQAGRLRQRYESIIASGLGCVPGRQNCASSIVSLLNQSPVWLRGVAPSTSAQVEMVRSIIAVMLGQVSECPCWPCSR
ncbi:TetR/AcrR family transcriptional regulator [Pseudomonas typographi]|uniref:TetR/AcrR family transcriptional regulator n=1 Tax=Pseudomonas typographi TaxID=2715964 RepID=UPI00237BAD81|nr:TetR/AcrR family transcriptional regulator [Pseudomonas typographi]